MSSVPSPDAVAGTFRLNSTGAIGVVLRSWASSARTRSVAPGVSVIESSIGSQLLPTRCSTPVIRYSRNGNWTLALILTGRT